MTRHVCLTPFSQGRESLLFGYEINVSIAGSPVKSRLLVFVFLSHVPRLFPWPLSLIFFFRSQSNLAVLIPWPLGHFFGCGEFSIFSPLSRARAPCTWNLRASSSFVLIARPRQKVDRLLLCFQMSFQKILFYRSKTLRTQFIVPNPGFVPPVTSLFSFNSDM